MIFFLYFRGVLLQRQNRLTEAIQSYKKAIHFRPKLIRKSISQLFCCCVRILYSFDGTAFSSFSEYSTYDKKREKMKKKNFLQLNSLPQYFNFSPFLLQWPI